MFALCNSEEAKKVRVDVRKGCNFTDFNCTEALVHSGTDSVDLFVHLVPPLRELAAFHFVAHCPCSAHTRCPTTIHTTCC